MKRILVFWMIFSSILLTYNLINAKKLNYPRVLLPVFNKISVNFTLDVDEKGCFKWMSSRQDLILITPVYNDNDGECSHSAVVTVLSREKKRSTAIVLAEDIATGESLRCDVILDVIDKLGVHTTTRQLYLEEAPETFELRAEDSQGNAFTTLEGVEFNWIISSLNRESANWSPALRFLTFLESLYHEVPKDLETFELEGKKGYMVLLEGINTGTARVTVNLNYPEYRHVQGIEVYINVLANIILEPSEVYIMAGDTITFRVLQLKMGKLTEISLNHQYYLEIENSTVAKIDGTRALGLHLGGTAVALRDRNVQNDADLATEFGVARSSIPSAQLTVVEAYKMIITLQPFNNWITVEGEKHIIALDLYTQNDHRITLSPRQNLRTELDESLFYVLQRNQNGTRLHGEAINEGATQVYGAFNDITAQAELVIYSELVIKPAKVLLPYDPIGLKTQTIKFHAEGGDGSYVWSSQNPRLVQINQNGVATTIVRDSSIPTKRSISGSGGASNDLYYDDNSLGIAHAYVRVAMAKNQHITRQAKIFFLPPIKLEIMKYNFETALRDYVHLHVGLFTFTNGTYVPFTNCDNLHFDLDFSSHIFQADYSYNFDDDVADGACQVLHLRSTAIGLSLLTLSYTFQNRILSDEVTLSVFEPLDLVNPLDGEIILPIGSSRNIIYANGPGRIYTLEAELIKSVKIDTRIAHVKDLPVESRQNLYALEVLCRKLGQTTLDFSVQNFLLSNNFETYYSNHTVTVYCVKPRFLNLYAREELRSSCPMEVKSSLLHLRDNVDKFEIEIEVQDSKNRKLMNISSLLIEWEFAAGEQLFPKDSIPHQRETVVDFYENIRLPGKDILVTKLGEVAPNLRIKGFVKRYQTEVLKKNSIKAEDPPFGIKNPRNGAITTPVIENEIRFMAVNSTFFRTNHVSIFMAKNSVQRFPINAGSGFYEFQLSENGIVDFEYDAKNREIIVTPLRIGNTRIELVDRCLMSQPAHLSISVVAIGTITVEAPDSVERTKTIEAIVKLYDSNDNVLHIDNNSVEVLQLAEVVFQPEILSVQLGEQHDLKEGEIRYIITGNQLGETKIMFTAGNAERQVSSEAFIVQVFPPLRLYPRNSTLVVGSNIQIFYHGGPQPNDNIIYEVHDTKVISMESAIVSALKLGETKITGKCVMIDPGSKTEVVVSEDTVEVHVVPLLNIQIKTPLTRIRSGAVMPAFIWGMPNLSPMVLGTLENMHIHWSTNQPDVIDIYSIFSDAGIEYSDTDLISVRIKALNPGKAKIVASVELPNGQKITTSVEVIVFKILQLESPKRILMDWILVPPRSTIQLKANLDDVIYKPDDRESNGIVKISPDGIVQTQEILGRDLVIAKTFEQSLPIGIEVKNIHYILISLIYPTIKFKETETKIPRGMSFVVKISLHDNLGNEFHHNIEDVNDLKYDLSHTDVVDVQIRNNLTVMINLPRETSNMIAISLKDSTGVKYAEDYIKLSVTESKHIYPTKTIFSVGDIICFDSPLTSLSSTWSSSNEKIVSIDKKTGVAQVLGKRFKLGEKIVVTNGDEITGNFIKFDVEVRDADTIQLLKSFDIFNGLSYQAHLVIRNRLQLDKFKNLIAKNSTKCSNALEKIPVKLFVCSLTTKQPLGQQLLEFYKVKPIFDVETGHYACQIDLLTGFTKILTMVKNNDVHFELEVKMANGLSDSLSLKFVPGIKVTPDSLFSNDDAEQELTITGLDKVLQKVEVNPSNKKLVDVTLETKAHGVLQYKIKILREVPPDEQLFIKVHSPVTLQNIEIPILTTSAMLEKCGQPFTLFSWGNMMLILSNIGFISTVLVLLAAGVWVYIKCCPDRNIRVNNEAFAPRSRQQSQRIIQTQDEPSFNRSANSPQNLYPIMSPYRDQNRSGSTTSHNSSANRSGSLTFGNDEQVYGDTTIISPQKRINRRYL